MSKIPLLDLKAQYKSYAREVWPRLKQIAQDQRFILGPENEGLETELAQYLGAKACVGVSSGSDALILALQAMGVGEGDEVITSPYTFFATAGAIVRVGARPRFVDVEEDTLNLDPRLVEKAINKKTQAIIPVHLFGHPCEMKALGKIARKHKLKWVEDAAQAIGSEYFGQRVGTFGQFGCFSFFPSKNLGGWGDGGFVSAHSAQGAERIKRLRNHGMHPAYMYSEVGINGRLDEIQAAVLRIKLTRLESWTEGRRRTANRYANLFAKSRIKDLIRLPVEREGCRHIYHQYVVRFAEGRDEYRQRLVEAGIGCAIYYPVPLHLQKCFADLGYRKGACPVSEQASRECLALPIYPELTAAQQRRVVEVLAGN